MEYKYNVETKKRKGLEPSEISLIIITVIVWILAIVSMIS